MSQTAGLWAAQLSPSDTKREMLLKQMSGVACNRVLQSTQARADVCCKLADMSRVCKVSRVYMMETIKHCTHTGRSPVWHLVPPCGIQAEGFSSHGLH